MAETREHEKLMRREANARTLVQSELVNQREAQRLRDDIKAEALAAALERERAEAFARAEILETERLAEYQAHARTAHDPVVNAFSTKRHEIEVSGLEHLFALLGKAYGALVKA